MASPMRTKVNRTPKEVDRCIEVLTVEVSVRDNASDNRAEGSKVGICREPDDTIGACDDHPASDLTLSDEFGFG